MNTTAHPLITPNKLQSGDKVAILSPSSGLPEIFPEVFEQGLQRLQELFQLVPVEYPTTRQMNSPLPERARDLHAAFADPDIKGIISSIGGVDEIKLLKHLDGEFIKANPKPFFGYSDNTNLHLFLRNLGILSYHGGSVMVQLGRGGRVHPYTLESLWHALFEQGEYEIVPPADYTDEDQPWDNASLLKSEPPMYPSTGWKWFNAGSIIEGPCWGGNLDITTWNLTTNKYIWPNEAYRDMILYLETDEELPSSTHVYRALMCMGERGLLQQFAAILVGRPKAWSIEQHNTVEQKATYVKDFEKAVLEALEEYHPTMPAVFNLDFGHTDPQFIIPNGGNIRIDGIQQRIFITY